MEDLVLKRNSNRYTNEDPMLSINTYLLIECLWNLSMLLNKYFKGSNKSIIIHILFLYKS